MSDLAPTSPQEFWRSPVAPAQGAEIVEMAGPMAEACSGCGAEFMVGAKFCHACGSGRLPRIAPERNWIQDAQAWIEHLEFHNIKKAIGLPMASLIAFLIGVFCALAAISVGLIYSIQTFADFQAVQLWRIEWLLAAVAAFVAGLLLKRPASSQK